MLQSQELQAMTVVQLRKLARENGVKLSAGIDKEGIVARLLAAQEGPGPSAQEAEESQAEADGKEAALQQAPLSADVTSVAPGHTGWQGAKDQEAERQQGFQPAYRQAWQARTAAPRQPGLKPSWQQPGRGAGTVSRFGPQINFVQNPAPASEPRMEEPSQPAEQAPRQEAAPQLDGYRLGYRAAPQRQSYNREYQRNDSYRPAYRQEAPVYPRPQPPVYGGQENFYNDYLYRPVRDPAFGEPYQRGQALPDLLQAGESNAVSGMLEILPDGYGFLRAETLLPGKSDIYVSVAQIRRYGLRTGDFVEGRARPQRNSDKFAALLYVDQLNGHEPKESGDRLTFDSMIPVYPNRRIVLESEQNRDNMTVRLADLVAPIGFGQRAMIIAPPDSGRIAMLGEIGKAIKQNDPKAHVMMLLVDAAPEEVTELREALEVEVFASTFAESPESQTRVSETMLESAQRLVENGQNVVILLDSLTKLTRAYQSALTQGGRAMTNTVTPAALVRPKRFFGMARNTREGGSLTIVATIAVETGSRVDDIIFEEFKGTANMELHLCAPELNAPIFPMIDLQLSGTKKEDMLLSEEEKEGLKAIRTVLSSTTNREAVVQLIDLMRKTKCNADLLTRLKDWMSLWEKSGYLGKKS